MSLGFNQSLTDIEALSALGSIGEEIYIYNNTALQSLEGLNSIKTINGSLRITGQPFIVNLQGLNGLKFIGGNLSVWTNPGLRNFEGLNNLQCMQGHLNIWDNKSLRNISGLTNLTSTGGFIKIYRNAILSSLSGLDNIEPKQIHYLNISENDSLSFCEIESICDYFAEPFGTFIIAANKKGCNTYKEIQESCEGLYPDPPSFHGNYLIYPNPADSWFNVIVNEDYVLEKVRLFNLSGQKVLEIESPNAIWNAGFLSTGLYIIELTINGEQFKDKIVVKK